VVLLQEGNEVVDRLGIQIKIATSLARVGARKELSR
jgi:hypothetical protein